MAFMRYGEAQSQAKKIGTQLLGVLLFAALLHITSLQKIGFVLNF
jgi:hypothetical protein